MIIKPEPIMLLILPIILSRISHPLFFIYSHAITYYSILFLKFDCVTCKIKTHGSESRGQEEAGLRDEPVSYLQVAPL